MFQKRLDGTVDFYRGWDDYEHGFGDLNGEFWLGLDKIHRLTKKPSKLRVELEDFASQTAYAEYDDFGVANEQSKYMLSLGKYFGKVSFKVARHIIFQGTPSTFESLTLLNKLIFIGKPLYHIHMYLHID